jgi:CBS domain-containing protein
MATISDILAGKSAHVLSIGPGATVLDAATLMNEHKIGSLLVIDDGRLIGIITERDMLQRVLAARIDPGNIAVGDVMTTELICCQPHTTVEEARGVLKNRRIRHLPVIDSSERLLGLISIGDLNAFEANDHERTIYILQEYIYGRA